MYVLFLCRFHVFECVCVCVCGGGGGGEEENCTQMAVVTHHVHRLCMSKFWRVHL